MKDPDWIGNPPEEPEDKPDEYDWDDYYYNQSKDKD